VLTVLRLRAGQDRYLYQIQRVAVASQPCGHKITLWSRTYRGPAEKIAHQFCLWAKSGYMQSLTHSQCAQRSRRYIIIIQATFVSLVV